MRNEAAIAVQNLHSRMIEQMRTVHVVLTYGRLLTSLSDAVHQLNYFPGTPVQYVTEPLNRLNNRLILEFRSRVTRLR